MKQTNKQVLFILLILVLLITHVCSYRTTYEMEGAKHYIQNLKIDQNDSTLKEHDSTIEEENLLNMIQPNETTLSKFEKQLTTTLDDYDDDDEALVEAFGSIAAVLKKTGTLVKKTLIGGLKVVKVKAGVLKGMLIKAGKAIPRKLARYMRSVLRYLKRSVLKAVKVLKQLGTNPKGVVKELAEKAVKNAKNQITDFVELLSDMQKTGISAVIKAKRAQNLKGLKALGNYVELVGIRVGRRNFLKFSSKKLAKQFTAKVFTEMAKNYADGLSRTLAEEYVKYVLERATKKEIKEAKKEFNVAQKIKDFFVPTDLCWKNTYGRGVGTIPNQCRGKYPEKGGLLCYKRCPRGMKRRGHVCWGYCKKGEIQTVALCTRRHREYFTRRRYHCRSGYHSCFFGYKCRVWAKTYKRPKTTTNFWGKSMKCRYGLQKSGGLCYPFCRKGYESVGPLCWRQCPKDNPFNCGAMCTKSEAVCAKKMVEYSLSAVSFVSNCVMGDAVAATLDVAMAIVDLASIPMCPRRKVGQKVPKLPVARSKCYTKTLLRNVVVNGDCKTKTLSKTVCKTKKKLVCKKFRSHKTICVGSRKICGFRLFTKCLKDKLGVKHCYRASKRACKNSQKTCTKKTYWKFQCKYVPSKRKCKEIKYKKTHCSGGKKENVKATICCNGGDCILRHINFNGRRVTSKNLFSKKKLVKICKRKVRCSNHRGCLKTTRVCARNNGRRCYKRNFICRGWGRLFRTCRTINSCKYVYQ